MSVFFTSDLHLGHDFCADKRGFVNVKEHDETIIANINDTCGKRDKLFILGDVAFRDTSLNLCREIKCPYIELIMGNHDKFPLSHYTRLGWKIHGFRGYKNYWLSHCPIHPSEIRKKLGNIHGHVHMFGDTPDITDNRYFNVNTEYYFMRPISFMDIEIMMKKRKTNHPLEFYESSGDKAPEAI